MIFHSPKFWQLFLTSIGLLSVGATQASTAPPTAPHVEVNIETKYEWGVFRSLCPKISEQHGKPWKKARRKLAQQGITELAPDSVEYGVLARYYEHYTAKDSTIQYIFAAEKDSNLLFVLIIEDGKLVGHNQGIITERHITNP